MRKRLTPLLLALASCLFTVFVFLNTYEVVFNRDIVFGISIRRMTIQTVLTNVVREFEVKQQVTTTETDETSSLEGMTSFEIPALKTKVTVEEGRKLNGQWYQRPSLAHDVGLNKDAKGTTVDYLVYTRKSWRTIPDPRQVEEGMEIDFYYKGGGKSAFRVAEKKALPLNRSFIVNKTEDRQILLVVEDPDNTIYYGYSLTVLK
jgi:hypothetical protein